MNNQEMMELTTVDKSEFEQLVKECRRSGSIDQNLYIDYDVKRGLRDRTVMVYLQVLQKYQMSVVMKMSMVEKFLSMVSCIFRVIM